MGPMLARKGSTLTAVFMEGNELLSACPGIHQFQVWNPAPSVSSQRRTTSAISLQTFRHSLKQAISLSCQPSTHSPTPTPPPLPTVIRPLTLIHILPLDCSLWTQTEPHIMWFSAPASFHLADALQAAPTAAIPSPSFPARLGRVPSGDNAPLLVYPSFGLLRRLAVRNQAAAMAEGRCGEGWGFLHQGPVVPGCAVQ